MLQPSGHPKAYAHNKTCVLFGPHRAIIARLLVMSGTNAQFSVGKMSLSGHTSHPRPVQTVPPAASHRL